MIGGVCMFSNFEEMFKYYKRRNIFTENDWYMLITRVIGANEAFLNRVVRPKMFQGRLNYGDYIRILSVL